MATASTTLGHAHIAAVDGWLWEEEIMYRIEREATAATGMDYLASSTVLRSSSEQTHI
jgi:hypothetical protein